MRFSLFTTSKVLQLILTMPLLLCVTRAQQCAPSPDAENANLFFQGMVGWWPGTGDNNCVARNCAGYNDIIGNNNGAPVGGTQFVKGKVGQAFSFNGVDAGVEVPSSPSLDITGPLTLAAWINSNAGGYGYIVIKDSETGLGRLHNYQLFIDGNNAVEFGLGDGSSYYQLPSITKISPGVWYLVAAVYDGNSQVLYINGIEDNRQVIGKKSLAISERYLRIGIVFEGSYYAQFNGLIDELNIFKRALSAKEILDIYDADSSGECPTARFARPVPMGVSVGNTPGLKGGTSGLLVQSASHPDRKYILSNNHVLGAIGPTYCYSSANKKNTGTLEPGPPDIGRDPGDIPKYHVGTVANFWPVLPHPELNDIDAAISRTDQSLAASAIFGIGEPNPAIGHATPGETVMMSGAATGYTEGIVQTIDTVMGFPLCGQTYDFEGQVIINMKSQDGDSGAAILDKNSKTPVALLFGGDSGKGLTYANAISTVFQKLGVCPESATKCASGPETTISEQDWQQAADPRLIELEGIQSRHVNDLMKINGVQAVGIGLAENNRDLNFQVYVTRITPEIKSAIPLRLEGVPIRLFEIGGEVELR
jgi:hypothetical protein